MEYSMSLNKLATARNPLVGRLAARLSSRTARVVVVGLGYVGLPLAETFAWGGYPVIGFDIDADIHNKLLITVAPDGYLKCVK